MINAQGECNTEVLELRRRYGCIPMGSPRYLIVIPRCAWPRHDVRISARASDPKVSTLQVSSQQVPSRIRSTLDSGVFRRRTRNPGSLHIGRSCSMARKLLQCHWDRYRLVDRSTLFKRAWPDFGYRDERPCRNPKCPSKLQRISDFPTKVTPDPSIVSGPLPNFPVSNSVRGLSTGPISSRP